MCQFIFVGENRSPRAIQLGVTWYDGRLAAKTLYDGLHAIGLDPHRQTYVNLWTDRGELDRQVLELLLEHLQVTGGRVVGMGRKACQELTRHHISHLEIIHPAARGKIRKTALYQAHLKEKLITPARAC
jgi:hypothetical protein